MLTELKNSGNLNNENIIIEMSMMGRIDEIFFRNELKKLMDEKKKHV